LVTFAFQLIKETDLTHWDIRLLSKIAADKDANTELLRNYDASKPHRGTKDELEESFAAAREIVEARQEQNRPERLLKKALSALRGVRSPDPKLAGSAIKTLLIDLNAEVSRIIKAAKSR
jgi:hypothetical protein